MPERLDRVTITLNCGEFGFSWEARQALLARLFHANIKDRIVARGTSTDEILRAFGAVGATRPVELTKTQRLLLLHVLLTWSENERWALEPQERMPEELGVLSQALADELHSGEQAADDA